MHQRKIVIQHNNKGQRWGRIRINVTTKLFRLSTTITLLLLLSIMPLETGKSFPNGVGEIGQQGCLCHGSSNTDTKIAIIGLPEKFESNVTYNLEIKITNLAIEMDANSANGGFRITVNQGIIEFNNSSDAQIIEEGWTHTEKGNKYRSWNFTWQSPDDNTTMVIMTVNANAVNGNGNSNGDEWNSISVAIPGVNYTGEVIKPDISGKEVTGIQLAVGAIGILVLLSLAFYAIKD